MIGILFWIRVPVDRGKVHTPDEGPEEQRKTRKKGGVPSPRPPVNLAPRCFQRSRFRIIRESKKDSCRFDKLKALSLPQGKDPETQRSLGSPFQSGGLFSRPSEALKGRANLDPRFSRCYVSSFWGLWVSHKALRHKGTLRVL